MNTRPNLFRKLGMLATLVCMFVLLWFFSLFYNGKDAP
jgi:hypothetical protein